MSIREELLVAERMVSSCEAMKEISETIFRSKISSRLPVIFAEKSSLSSSSACSAARVWMSLGMFFSL